MTREKMKERYLDMAPYGFETEKIYDYGRIMKVVDDCYDDFESRVCENCVYWNQENSSQKEHNKGMCFQYRDTDKYYATGITQNNYGCNKFKRRTK